MIKLIEFISASTAGIVNVQLGFKPDFCWFIQAHGGTNPNMYFWLNPKYKGSGDAAGWPAALSLLLTGSSGIVTRDTTGITVLSGGTELTATETDNSDPKHIDLYGNPGTDGDITVDGVAIPADHQTNSGRNLLIAIKEDGAVYGE